MGGAFTQDFIESVRGAADIVRVISDYVPLKAAGNRLKGLCPFHQEKTPSFSVDPSAQLFYCFGCQTGGDLFKFVMLYDKVPFPEAVESLAKRFGVPLPAKTGGEHDPRERFVEMVSRAEAWFRSRLNDERIGKPCREYMKKRGLSESTGKRLRLGYAPDEWDGLLRAAGREFKPEELHRGGLVLPRKSGQGHYDRFRDRLIFPIRDINGRTRAFGGRAVGDGEPKYINSPETPTYTKGDHLYGLDLAREAIRAEGFVIVVEGYLDLAAVAQAGCENVVATLGTAFTPAQAKLLARFTERITFSYDGDSAGAQATARSVDLLLSRGFEVRVVDLPKGCDPDDLIRRDGVEAYRKLLAEAPEYLEFLIRREARARDLDRVDQKVAAVNAVLPHLTKLKNSIERTSWATRLADALGIEDGLVLQELRAALKSAQTEIRQRARPVHDPREAEMRLVWGLLRSEEDRNRLVEEIDWADLQNTQVGTIVRTILRMTEAGEPVEYPTVLSSLEDENDQALLTRIAFREQPADGPSVSDCLWAFRRERLTRQGRRAVRELGKIQQEPSETTDVDRQLLEVQQLAKQRDALLTEPS